MNQLIDKWEEILYVIKASYNISDLSFKTWLKDLKVHSVTDDTVRILVTNASLGEMGVDFISKKYTEYFQDTLSEFFSKSYQVKFLLPEDAKKLDVQEAPAPEKKAPAQNLSSVFTDAGLDPKYTFDTFVVGNNNKFAHAAALAVAESPGNAYNPLFIYGGAGLGKTHLMHSIAHYILEQNPDQRVLYITSEKFTNELIDSIRNGNNTAMTRFREKYRNVDVLLIDDIQFIIGKESTQEEFFHTFNDLYGARKQIIISSDKPPKDMETLESRLRSRFEWGLIADISLPDYETRMAILHKKEEIEGYHIDSEVIEYIAMNIKSNIRELEGALTKLVAINRLEGREINVELAERELKDIVFPEQKQEVTCSYIIDMVADHYQISSSDIRGQSRRADISKPRQIAMYLCSQMTNAPLTQIGAEMGKRDHTTVMHGIKKITLDISKSESLKNTVEILKKKIIPSA